MAVTVDELRSVMRMELGPYTRDLQRLHGLNASTARRMEETWRSTAARFDRLGRSMALGISAPLASIAGAITTKEVLAYADAWTTAKNSLAVAGVVGENQAAVLDRIYQSAQANGAPITAMADLFGKAAQASDNLGASQKDLLKFNNGVGVSLRVAGTSASAASGALTQLGQLLGQARVQAEEFNSVNEGARPILIAVANGLDAAGGSVSKLKKLVNDGEVSGREFFQAFLKGLPVVEKMAANATQTIDQGMTKVGNAFTRYIGETDESLGASQRLVAGLNALADNFDQTADIVLKLAAVIAAGLVGRSLVKMISTLGEAAGAVWRFAAAARAASSIGGLGGALGGLAASAGPVGFAIGATVVGALALFSSSSSEASAGARTYAQALEEVRTKAEEVAPAIEGAAQAIDEKAKNALASGVDAGVAGIENAKAAVLDLFDVLFRNVDRDTISPKQIAQIEELREGLETGTVSAEKAEQALFALANSNPNFQAVADSFSPLLQALGQAIAATDLLRGKLSAASGGSLTPEQMAGYRQYGQSRQQGEEMLRIGKAYADEAARQNSLSKEQLAVEKEIASIKKDLADKGGFLPDGDVRALAERNVSADGARSKSGRAKGVKPTADSRLTDDIQAVRDRTAALVEEQRIIGLSYRAQEERRMALDLEQTALADLREEARRKGQTDLANIRLSDEQISRIREVSAAYAEQADALRLVQEEQRRSEDAASEFYDTFKSETIGAINGAKSLGEALSTLAKKFGDMLLNSGFDSLFKPRSGSSGGGLFGGIFDFLGGFLGGGGGFRANTTLGNFLSGVPGFADGTPTHEGPGRVRGPGGDRTDGIFAWLSRDEHVTRAPMARKHRALLDAINADALPRFANGTPPALRALAMPIPPQQGGMTVSAPVNVSIDATAADAAGFARVSKQLAELKASLPGLVVANVKDAQKRRKL